MQPPSGGCVLKQIYLEAAKATIEAAAFGRLCVETQSKEQAAQAIIAAAFGRLCVETISRLPFNFALGSSRLRAAVC